MKVLNSKVLSKEKSQEILEIGSMICALREAAGLSQSEAAIRSAVSRNTAYRIEIGDEGVSIGVLLRYIQAIQPDFSLGTLARWITNSHDKKNGDLSSDLVSTRNNPDYDF